jgi:hypothetical protein
MSNKPVTPVSKPVVITVPGPVHRPCEFSILDFNWCHTHSKWCRRF